MKSQPTGSSTKFKKAIVIIWVFLALLIIAFYFLVSKTEKANFDKLTQAEKDSVITINKTKEAGLYSEREFKKNLNDFNGSFTPLVEKIKSTLNDASSFEHVDTKYDIFRDSSCFVQMTFRAKNAYGAKVLHVVQARGNVTGEITSLNYIK